MPTCTERVQEHGSILFCSPLLAARGVPQGGVLYDWLTAPLRPLPSALIIGSMKVGTSTLNAWLRHHPQVMFSAIKEVHVFDEPLIAVTAGIAPISRCEWACSEGAAP